MERTVRSSYPVQNVGQFFAYKVPSPRTCINMAVTHLHLMPMFRLNGAWYPFPSVSSYGVVKQRDKFAITFRGGPTEFLHDRPGDHIFPDLVLFT